VNPDDFAKLRGEWIGTGPFTLGPFAGTATEYVRLEAADVPHTYAYVRRSRIVIPNAPANTHNETGFIRLKSIGLMLARGTYNILEWNDATGDYRQIAGSADTQDMQRKITVVAEDEIKWFNFMKVLFQGQWVEHTVDTHFFSVLKAVAGTLFGDFKMP
jgi:hypothetical protein